MNSEYQTPHPDPLLVIRHQNTIKLEQLAVSSTAHRFCVKYMQGLSIRTRTDAALSLLGIYSIESEIDFRKLTLFGQFSRNISNCWVHDCFYRRLASFTINNVSQK